MIVCSHQGSSSYHPPIFDLRTEVGVFDSIKCFLENLSFSTAHQAQAAQPMCDGRQPIKIVTGRQSGVAWGVLRYRLNKRRQSTAGGADAGGGASKS
jgi:hypothetical protein